MRIRVSGLKTDSVFGSDCYLKVSYSSKKDTYNIHVKKKLDTGDKISRFFSNLFGTECRQISQLLNSDEGQTRLKQVDDKEVRENLKKINLPVELFFADIPSFAV